MAFDFTNRDPKDPHGVATYYPSTSDAWLPAAANDWSQFTVDAGQAAQQGLTRKVKVGMVTLNNGEQYFAVQDAQNKPIDVIGDRTGYDAKQQQVWQQTGPKQIPPGGTPTQKREAPDGQIHIFGWNPETGQYDVDQGVVGGGQTQTEGTPDPTKPGGFDNERPRMVTRDANNQIIKVEPLSGDQEKVWREARERSRNPGGLTDAEVLARAPQVAAGTLNTDSPYYLKHDPATGADTWAPNPNYHKPKPEPFGAPSDQEYVIWRNADGTTTKEKNDNYRPPSKLVQGPDGRWEELTVDQNGKPVIRPVTRETTIKPAELPVLQAQYGQIAQGLGTLLADLNRRVASGEITPQERDTAFTAAHQQADTQVSEINSILSNSRATWAQDVAQQNQTFGEAASRRGFAQGLTETAFRTGADLAARSGRGSGQKIAEGMAAMLDIGQKYAAGMGGFPSMDAVPVPRAVQQARDIGLPGFGAAAVPAAAGPPGAPAGGAPAGPLPAGPAAPAPVFRPPPPISGAPVSPAGPPPPTPGEPGGPPLSTAITPLPLTGQRPPTPGEPGGPPLQTTIPPLPLNSASSADEFGRTPGSGGAVAIPPGPVPGSQTLPETPSVSGAPFQQNLPEAPGGVLTPTPYSAPSTLPFTGQGTNPRTMPWMGQNPGMQLMSTLGSRFGTTVSPVGLPATVGGSGYFDLGQVAQGMLGDGSDPAWAEAVRQAYGAMSGAGRMV